jgi:hypothetical protein
MSHTRYQHKPLALDQTLNYISKQGGFIIKWKISDNIIIIQETIHSNNLSKENRMIIKWDMENAFNRVRHSFIYAVLEKF